MLFVSHKGNLGFLEEEKKRQGIEKAHMALVAFSFLIKGASPMGA